MADEGSGRLNNKTCSTLASRAKRNHFQGGGGGFTVLNCSFSNPNSSVIVLLHSSVPEWCVSDRKGTKY